MPVTPVSAIDFVLYSLDQFEMEIMAPRFIKLCWAVIVPLFMLLGPFSGPLLAQTSDQWKSTEKQMMEFLAEGYSIHSIIVDQITPVSSKAVLYFLTKGSALVKCSEETTRRNGAIKSRVIGYSELTKPFTAQ